MLYTLFTSKECTFVHALLFLNIKLCLLAHFAEQDKAISACLFSQVHFAVVIVACVAIPSPVNSMAKQ